MISNINDDLSIVIQMPCFEGHIVIFLVEPIYFYLRFRKHSFFTIRLKFMILIQNLKPLIFKTFLKQKVLILKVQYLVLNLHFLASKMII